MTDTTNTAKKEPGRHSWLIRITAAVLAVIMIAGVVVYQQTNIQTVSEERQENKAVKIAAKQLLEDSDYANASRLERMSTYTRSIFTSKSTSKDYEIAGQIAVTQGNYEEAIALTSEAIRLLDDGNEAKAAELYLRMGYLHIMQENYEEAVKWLDLGIELTPTMQARIIRAQALVNLGRAQEAHEDITRMLEEEESGEAYIADLVNVYEAAGDYSTAADLCSRLYESTGSAEYLLNRAYCYTNLGQMEKAASDRERYAQAGGTETGAADVMLGIGWMRAGEYDKAGQQFIKALEGDYADPDSLYYYVVLCSYITQNYEQACEYGDKLIAKINQGEDTGIASVRVEDTTGKLQVSLAKTDLSSLCLMTGASHVQMGDFDQAVDSLTACLEQNGGVVYANYLRGTCLLAAGKYEEAEKDFDAAIAAGEESERSHYGRGLCRMELGDREGAMADFDWVVLNGSNQELFEESSALLLQLMREEETTEATEDNN